MSFSTGQSPRPDARRWSGCALIERRANRLRCEKGQALVEFALVLPMIIVVLFGVVLFGLALNDWIDETQLASSAARWAAVNNEHGLGGEINQPSFVKWVKEQGDNENVKNATVTMCSPTSTVGDYVEVKLTYNYKWFEVAGLFAKLFGGTGIKAETPITVTAQNMIEKQPIAKYPTAC
jgi:Flp pilus assembly protein TadG